MMMDHLKNKILVALARKQILQILWSTIMIFYENIKFKKREETLAKLQISIPFLLGEVILILYWADS